MAIETIDVCTKIFSEHKNCPDNLLLKCQWCNFVEPESNPYNSDPLHIYNICYFCYIDVKYVVPMILSK